MSLPKTTPFRFILVMHTVPNRFQNASLFLNDAITEIDRLYGLCYEDTYVHSTTTESLRKTLMMGPGKIYLEQCAWWWWFGVSFSPPSTSMVVDDIVVTLWKIPLGSAFWVWKCQRQIRGDSVLLLWQYTVVDVLFHDMRVVFKTK